MTAGRRGFGQERKSKQTRKKLLLIYPGKAVAKKGYRKQEMCNDDRGFMFLTELGGNNSRYG